MVLPVCFPVGVGATGTRVGPAWSVDEEGLAMGVCRARSRRDADGAAAVELALVVKGLTGGPTGDWSLEEYTALRLTR